MTTTTDLANVPFPAGACHVDDWDGPDEPHPSRCFLGSQHIIERLESDRDIEAYITGVQQADGQVERKIAVGHVHWDRPITVEQARQLAAALIAAAGEAEAMSNYTRSKRHYDRHNPYRQQRPVSRRPLRAAS